MGNLFDKLAKDAAAEMPRREAFRRIGGGLIGVVLVAVGLAADSTTCGKLCAECCNNLDFPPRSQEHAQCIQNCHAGIGTNIGTDANPLFVCGPLECPGGLQG